MAPVLISKLRYISECPLDLKTKCLTSNPKIQLIQSEPFSYHKLSERIKNYAPINNHLLEVRDKRKEIQMELAKRENLI